MALIDPTLPTIGQPNSTEDPDLLSALNAIISAINGGIDAANLSSTLAATLGTGTAGRGKSIIAAEEARTGTVTAYATMPTPDQVTVTLPTDGLIFMAYQASWKESVNGAARAAFFIGANQLKIARMDFTAPQAQETQCLVQGGAVNVYKPLASFGGGLIGNSSLDNSAYLGDVTTGQVVGVIAENTDYAPAPCVVFAAAGTYTINVQLKASSGAVTAKNRKLWVWTQGF